MKSKLVKVLILLVLLIILITISYKPDVKAYNDNFTIERILQEDRIEVLLFTDNKTETEYFIITNIGRDKMCVEIIERNKESE